MSNYQLPTLSYDFNALEPHIDEQTMMIHHDRHHATYVNNLNAALEKHNNLANKTIEDLITNLDAIPEDIRTAVRNNGGGHANHSLFWKIISPNAGGKPTGEIADGITQAFGSYEKFKEEFTKAATTRFGSGWAWLVVENEELKITSTPNQDSPLMAGQTPVLGLDVWEHAYYLNYQNKRPDYINAFFNIINWNEVNKLYKSSRL